MNTTNWRVYVSFILIIFLISIYLTYHLSLDYWSVVDVTSDDPLLTSTATLFSSLKLGNFSFPYLLFMCFYFLIIINSWLNLGLWIYCIWWLIWDIWIMSIAYCLSYLDLGLLLIGYLFGLETFFLLAMCIINVGLLIDMNFGPTMWVKFVGWLEYLIWALPIWTI